MGFNDDARVIVSFEGYGKSKIQVRIRGSSVEQRGYDGTSILGSEPISPAWACVLIERGDACILDDILSVLQRCERDFRREVRNAKVECLRAQPLIRKV